MTSTLQIILLEVRHMFIALQDTRGLLLHFCVSFFLFHDDGRGDKMIEEYREHEEDEYKEEPRQGAGAMCLAGASLPVVTKHQSFPLRYLENRIPPRSP